MFALVVVGWLLTSAALVTGEQWLFAAAAPFLLVPGVLALLSSSAWAALARTATAGGLYGARYREHVMHSRLLRLTIGGGLVLFALFWLALGTLR